MTTSEDHERLGADPEVTSEDFLSYGQEISRIDSVGVADDALSAPQGGSARCAILARMCG